MMTAENEYSTKDMYACIALAKEPDPHLTNASLHFHESMGFRKAGVFHNSGYKFDTWYDMIWMEKIIGIHGKNQNGVKFGEYGI